MSEGKAVYIKIKEACRQCGHMTNRISRKGYTWKCHQCGHINLGPGLLTDRVNQATEPSRRGRPRRGAVVASVEPATPAPAPVRRKAPARASQPAPVAAATAAPAKSQAKPQPKATPRAPAPRGLIDRLWFGAEEAS